MSTQLRWVVRNKEGDLKLQYRTKTDKTFYAGPAGPRLGGPMVAYSYYEWSEWTDVPIVNSESL